MLSIPCDCKHRHYLSSVWRSLRLVKYGNDFVTLTVDLILDVKSILGCKNWNFKWDIFWWYVFVLICFYYKSWYMLSLLYLLRSKLLEFVLAQKDKSYVQRYSRNFVFSLFILLDWVRENNARDINPKNSLVK